MSKKHVLIMLVCCMLPIVGLGAIYLFKIPVNTVVWGALILLCPISHLFMMKFMMQEHSAEHPTSPMHPDRE